MSRIADAMQMQNADAMQMQSRCNADAECIADADALQNCNSEKQPLAISNGLRARGAGPDLRATPTAA